MSIDFQQIQLGDDERKLLAALADQTGKPWGEILREALSLFRSKTVPRDENGNEGRSLYDALMGRGLIGCLDGPADLSTNPKYMEGFGRE
jgi:hypothetical protein